MGLNLGMYNIWDGHGYVLPQEIRSVERGNYNLMILTETMFLDVVFFHNHLRYEIVCSKATVNANGGAQRGVGIVPRETPEDWIVDSMRFHGPNMVFCDILSRTNECL